MKFRIILLMITFLAIAQVEAAVLHIWNRTTPSKNIKITGYNVTYLKPDADWERENWSERQSLVCRNATKNNILVPYATSDSQIHERYDTGDQNCNIVVDPVQLTINGGSYHGTITFVGLPPYLTANDLYIEVYDNYVKISSSQGGQYYFSPTGQQVSGPQ